jgi:hypothetical protein
MTALQDASPTGLGRTWPMPRGPRAIDQGCPSAKRPLSGQSAVASDPLVVADISGWEAAVNGGSIGAERYSGTANDLPEISIRGPKGEK